MGIMSAFNYIGNRFAGACDELQGTVLRDEWGFRGMIITDWFGDCGYMISDNIIRNSGDKMFASSGEITILMDQTSPTAVSEMRRVCHNILYTLANSNIMHASNYEMPTWEKAFIGSDIALAVLLVAAEVLIVLRSRKKYEEAQSGKK